MASGTIKAVVGRSDIVNNLTTNDSTKVLSAAQGKALKDAADTLNSNLSNYMTIRDYGSTSSGTSIKNHIIGMMDDAIADTTFPTSAYCPITKTLTGQDEYRGIAMKFDSSHGQLIVWDSSNHMYRCTRVGNSRYVGEFTGTNM